MDEGQHSRKQATLVHPPSLSPQDLATFIQLKPFARAWKKLGLTETDLAALEMLIMTAPQGPPVVPGTGGLRKVRFAPARWKRGKSGAARICYAYYPEYSLALLVVAYGKARKDDLTQEEERGIKSQLVRFKRLLDAGRGKVGHPHGSKD